MRSLSRKCSCQDKTRLAHISLWGLRFESYRISISYIGVAINDFAGGIIYDQYR